MHYSPAMVTLRSDTCDKCKRANPIDYRVEPGDAWKLVVLNRWKKLCPSCFDQLAEAASWSDRPVQAKRYGRRR